MRPGLAAVLGLALACAQGDPSGVAVERDSPATRGDRLSESIGIEVEEGRLTAILEAGCALPCEDTVTFGTWEPEQPEILIYLFRGNGDATASAHSLGTWEISGYPIASADTVDVAVTFRAERDGIYLEVADATSDGVTIQRSEDAGGE